MNLMPSRPLRAALVAAALILPASAQNARIQIQSLEKLAAQATEVVDVTLEGPVLKMAGKFLGSDPEARQLVQGLTGVFVRSFAFDKPGAYQQADVEAIRAQLQGPAWARIVSVRGKKEKEQVEVYLLSDGSGNPQGLVVWPTGSRTSPPATSAAASIWTASAPWKGSSASRNSTPRSRGPPMKPSRSLLLAALCLALALPARAGDASFHRR